VDVRLPLFLGAVHGHRHRTAPPAAQTALALSADSANSVYLLRQPEEKQRGLHFTQYALKNQRHILN